MYLNWAPFIKSMDNLERIKSFLKTLKEENIKFKKHFYDKIKERPISEKLVRECIKKTDKLLKIEEQTSKITGEEKYKLWIKLSNRYSLVIIAYISEKDLYIITSWNIDRKWQKEIQK